MKPVQFILIQQFWLYKPSTALLHVETCSWHLYSLINVGLWTHASCTLFLWNSLSPQFRVSLFSKDMLLLGSLFSSLVASDGEESACNARDSGLITGLGRSPRGGLGNPLQYSCLENPRGQRILAGYSPWSHKESDTTEWLSTGFWLATPTQGQFMKLGQDFTGHICKMNSSYNPLNGGFLLEILRETFISIFFSLLRPQTEKRKGILLLSFHRRDFY